jgi:hypothetical protein
VKVEGWLFLGCGIFFGGSDIAYWYLSHDPTGTTALALSVGLAMLTGFYMLFTGRRLPLRPEDDEVGEIEQGTGEIGFFSPHSWCAVPGFLRRGDRARRGDRLVDGPHRAAIRGVLQHRLRLRVLPRSLRALSRCVESLSR